MLGLVGAARQPLRSRLLAALPPSLRRRLPAAPRLVASLPPPPLSCLRQLRASPAEQGGISSHQAGVQGVRPHDRRFSQHVSLDCIPHVLATEVAIDRAHHAWSTAVGAP